MELPDSVAASIVLNHDEFNALENTSREYRVKLGVQPTGPVDLEISVRRPGSPTHDKLMIARKGYTLTPSTINLNFNSNNWNNWKTMIVQGAEDADSDHETGFVLRHNPSGGGYGSAPTVTLPVFIEDDDAVAGLVLSAAAVNVDEGASANYTVKLATAPSADVTVAVTGANDDLTVNPASLFFPMDDWYEARTVTVTAASGVSAGAEEVTLTHTPSGGDYGSGQVGAEDLTVNIVRDIPRIASQGVSVESSPLHGPNVYARGETIAVAVEFDSNIEVDTSGGQPTLAVDFGAAGSPVQKSFAYVGTAGNRTLDFEYEVLAGDSDSDGISVSADALALNGATIRAAGGQRDADASATALQAQSGHTVDGDQTLAPAGLTALKLSYGGVELPLTPAFNTNVVEYDVAAAATVDQANVEYTEESGATVNVLPADADTGTAGHQVTFDGAETGITLAVTRPPRSARTYTVTVTRTASGVSVTSPSTPVAPSLLQDIVFTVARSSAELTPLDVNLSLVQSGNFLPASKLSHTVTIPANQDTATLTLRIRQISPAAPRPNGTLTATVDADSSYTVSGSSATVMDVIAANPAVTVRSGARPATYLDRETPDRTPSPSSPRPRPRITAVPGRPGRSCCCIAGSQNGTAYSKDRTIPNFGTCCCSFAGIGFQFTVDGLFTASKTFDVTLTERRIAE